MSKNVVYIGAAAILAAIIAGFYFFNLGHTDLSKATPDITITSEELYSHFANNETEANQTYVNKIIDITGKVIHTEVTSDGGVNISLDSGGSFGNVICSFSPKESENLEKIEIGDVITFRGICTGMLLDVLLNNCILIKNP